MRFPSLIRLPRTKQFGIEPRYYDPVKEEIEERTRRIKQEMDAGEGSDVYVPGRISFERKTESVPNASLLQLAIASILGLTVVGWLYLGNDVFYYIAYIAIPIYVYFRFIRRKRKK
jgi:hypothetical protein